MSETDLPEPHTGWPAIIKNTVFGPWQTYLRGFLTFWSLMSLTVNAGFLTHWYVYPLSQVADQTAILEPWMVVSGSLIYLGLLYWIYSGGLTNAE